MNKVYKVSNLYTLPFPCVHCYMYIRFVKNLNTYICQSHSCVYINTPRLGVQTRHSSWLVGTITCNILFCTSVPTNMAAMTSRATNMSFFKKRERTHSGMEFELSDLESIKGRSDRQA